jgi:predicted permease
VMDPFRVIGAAAVPIVLLSFGMSLHGQKPRAPGPERSAPPRQPHRVPTKSASSPLVGKLL